jgi:hypothetical protein
MKMLFSLCRGMFALVTLLGLLLLPIQFDDVYPEDQEFYI